MGSSTPADKAPAQPRAARAGSGLGVGAASSGLGGEGIGRHTRAAEGCLSRGVFPRSDRSPGEVVSRGIAFWGVGRCTLPTSHPPAASFASGGSEPAGGRPAGQAGGGVDTPSQGLPVCSPRAFDGTLSRRFCSDSSSAGQVSALTAAAVSTGGHWRPYSFSKAAGFGVFL